MSVFVVVSFLIMHICVKVWRHICCDDDVDSSHEKSLALSGEICVETWKKSAKSGQLDFYTCMALAMGREKNLRRTMRYLPRLVVLSVLQFWLVVLFLRQEDKDHSQRFVPIQQSQDFRLIGSILFAYSAYYLYQAMWDGCREQLLQSMLMRDVSGWYTWTILFGEYVNTIVSAMLMVLLYLVYCECKTPTELLINCCAMNFLADVDNMYVDENDRSLACEHLKEYLGEWSSRPRESALVRRVSRVFNRPGSEFAGVVSSTDSEASARREAMGIFQGIALHTNIFIRGCVPFLGYILLIAFAFAGNESLCVHMRAVEPWPFCVK